MRNYVHPKEKEKECEKLITRGLDKWAVFSAKHSPKTLFSDKSAIIPLPLDGPTEIKVYTS